MKILWLVTARSPAHVRCQKQRSDAELQASPVFREDRRYRKPHSSGGYPSCGSAGPEPTTGNTRVRGSPTTFGSHAAGSDADRSWDGPLSPRSVDPATMRTGARRHESRRRRPFRCRFRRTGPGHCRGGPRDAVADGREKSLPWCCALPQRDLRIHAVGTGHEWQNGSRRAVWRRPTHTRLDVSGASQRKPLSGRPPRHRGSAGSRASPARRRNGSFPTEALQRGPQSRRRGVRRDRRHPSGRGRNRVREYAGFRDLGRNGRDDFACVDGEPGRRVHIGVACANIRSRHRGALGALPIRSPSPFRASCRDQTIVARTRPESAQQPAVSSGVRRPPGKHKRLLWPQRQSVLACRSGDC